MMGINNRRDPINVATPTAPGDRRPMHAGEAFAAQLRRVCLESTSALVATMEAKDAFTRHHSVRVARYSRRIAERLGLSSDQVERIATAAKLHDIGKIGVPDAILNKPGPLNEAEFEIVKRHPRIGCDILGHATHLHRDLPLILHHHERYDGGGYPGGLSGRRIPLGARILAVADALDAMLSSRSYKPPMTLAQARAELRRCRGAQFDPDIVDVTLAWLAPTPPRQAGEARMSVGAIS